ncbi:MAG: hypothetical protein ABSG87_07760, partial [Verrucomicrobiota bacterium]
ISILLLTGLATGCKRSAGPSGYFKTPFQDESQFIVEAIVSDLAEQIYYAKFQRLPDQDYFQVTATEEPGSPQDTPVYDLQIGLDTKLRKLKSKVDVSGPIWSPEVYEDVAQNLADAVGLSAGTPDSMEDTTLLSKLTDGSAETVEKENENLSGALENNFTDPALHEQAAVLLGVFTLREHSGHFFEIRSPLSRITAHLAMAHLLGGDHAYGINGQMAEAMLLTLVGDEVPALQQLNAINTNDTAVASFVRALRVRNTGDYRLLSAGGLSRVESIAWFEALADYTATASAWPQLSDEQKQTIDFVRIAYEEGYSVEMGHQLMDVALPLEFQEINEVYELSQHKKLNRDGLLNALNELPEHCFTKSDGAVHVRVIGWGQWAAFLQRQLCHAIQQDFYMLQYMWGVPNDAKEFAAKCDQDFGGLRLYPFVRRFDCTDEKSYHKAVDDGFKVTVATPQFVPADCWNWLCYRVNFAPPYNPNPNPHVDEWHNHNPPPGTVYDLNPRLNHPSLTSRPDVMAFFEKLHELAPYDCRIGNFILKNKYNNHPTYDQAMDLYSNMLSYCLTAITAVANTVYDQPDQYEKLMLQAAQLNPASYYNLGYYYFYRHEEDKAAQYYDQACNADPDSVRISNMALWRVRYYLKKGQTDKARQIADDGAEVYSSIGLQAEAVFFELTSNYDEAFNWFAKNEDRYNDSAPLLDFCMRYKAKTGDNRFDSEVQKRISKIFPKGIEKVSLKDFSGPPTDGVLIRQENDLLTSAGLKRGNVIVAVYGVRVHNFEQYAFARGLKDTPELDLIVWQGDGYHEYTPAPPNHLFGADFGDYTP